MSMKSLILQSFKWDMFQSFLYFVFFLNIKRMSRVELETFFHTT